MDNSSKDREETNIKKQNKYLKCSNEETSNRNKYF